MKPVEITACVFCRLDEDRAILAESALAFAIYDKFPVNPGHVLIIPKRHTGDYFDLTPEEQQASFDVLRHVKPIVERVFSPAGYNVGINVGEAAGQTVGHVHVHLIPRYANDVANPRGGVRGVIPGRKEY
jgi:diadenosine tetraphosphate (Ap4A) HIT family hydrolase